MQGRKLVLNRSTSRNKGRSVGPPTVLHGLLDAAVEDLGIEQKLVECRARMAWEEAVGSSLAQHTSPLRLFKGYLEVAVPSAVWRTQLNFMQRDIAARINSLLGKKVVKGLKLLNQSESVENKRRDR